MKKFMDYDFNITEITTACFTKAGKGKARFVNRASHGIAMHLGGDKEYNFSDGRVVRVTANSLIYLPKASNYYVRTFRTGDCYAINFNISEDVSFEPFVVCTKTADTFIHLFKSARNHWDLKVGRHKMRCKAELYRIICNMQDEYRNSYLPKSKYKIIEPAVDYINKSFTSRPLNISELAKMCDITPEYFRRVFRDFFGDSPVMHINKMKISRAKELLMSGMYSVSEVCELSGYSDPSHFSREFKKATGFCPSEYSENTPE